MTRTFGVFVRAESLKIDLALLSSIGCMEMGASNTGDDSNKFLEELDLRQQRRS